jgi:hypothetical protein
MKINFSIFHIIHINLLAMKLFRIGVHSYPDVGISRGSRQDQSFHRGVNV